MGAALPNSQQGCIGALEDDFYANSSKPSQAGYYNTWSRLAAAWQMPPIPITKQLFLAIGASMKDATVPLKTTFTKQRRYTGKYSKKNYQHTYTNYSRRSSGASRPFSRIPSPGVPVWENPFLVRVVSPVFLQ